MLLMLSPVLHACRLARWSCSLLCSPCQHATPHILIGPYSATVKLPVTEFSLRANSAEREPEIQSKPHDPPHPPLVGRMSCRPHLVCLHSLILRVLG